jgi:hypothetical protein
MSSGSSTADRPIYPTRVAVSGPNIKTVSFLGSLQPQPMCVGEIGIYRGDTSRAIADLLGSDGELHLFDFESTVDRVVHDLSDASCRIIPHGNSAKLLDSYIWPLMRMLEEHDQPVFDYVFIDGAHTWHHDGFAFLLVDRLLKTGGYVDFDDYSWTLESSPSLNPTTFPATGDWYTPEQIGTAQVRKVVELLVRRDDRYAEVVEDKVFRKIG